MFCNITIAGHLGKDPEIKRLSNGATTGRFSVACNKDYKAKDGATVKKTTWFNVEAYQAKDSGLVTGLIQPYLKKGQLVLISGEPEIETYDKDGVETRVFKIKLGPQSTLKMMGGGNGKKPEGENAANTTQDGTAPAGASSDDIPF